MDSLTTTGVGVEKMMTFESGKQWGISFKKFLKIGTTSHQASKSTTLQGPSFKPVLNSTAVEMWSARCTSVSSFLFARVSYVWCLVLFLTVGWLWVIWLIWFDFVSDTQHLYSRLEIGYNWSLERGLPETHKCIEFQYFARVWECFGGTGCFAFIDFWIYSK